MVLVLSMPSSEHLPLKMSDWKERPGPNVPNFVMKLSTKAVQMVLLSRFGIAIASVHLVKRSIMTSMYLFPCFAVGKGPSISIATRSMGSPLM